MTETLPALLLQLSEASGRAYLSGSAAKPFAGMEFERLLGRQVLVEQERLDTWSACSTCECEWQTRSIQVVAGQLVAVCPFAAEQDLFLDADDVRVFEIRPERLVAEIAQASNATAVPEKVIEFAWRMEIPALGPVVMILSQTALLASNLMPALCFALQAERGIVLLPRISPAELRNQFVQAGFRTYGLGACVRSDWSLDVGQLSRHAPLLSDQEQLTTRLVISSRDKRAVLDGTELGLTEQLFRALEALANAQTYVEIGLLERKVYLADGLPAARATRDIINKLRRAIYDRSLITTRRRPTRFRLELEPSEIRIDP